MNEFNSKRFTSVPNAAERSPADKRKAIDDLVANIEAAEHDRYEKALSEADFEAAMTNRAEHEAQEENDRQFALEQQVLAEPKLRRMYSMAQQINELRGKISVDPSAEFVIADKESKLAELMDAYATDAEGNPAYDAKLAALSFIIDQTDTNNEIATSTDTDTIAPNTPDNQDTQTEVLENTEETEAGVLQDVETSEKDTLQETYTYTVTEADERFVKGFFEGHSYAEAFESYLNMCKEIDKTALKESWSKDRLTATLRAFDAAFKKAATEAKKTEAATPKDVDGEKPSGNESETEPETPETDEEESAEPEQEDEAEADPETESEADKKADANETIFSSNELSIEEAANEAIRMITDADPADRDATFNTVASAFTQYAITKGGRAADRVQQHRRIADHYESLASANTDDKPEEASNSDAKSDTTSAEPTNAELGGKSQNLNTHGDFAQMYRASTEAERQALRSQTEQSLDNAKATGNSVAAEVFEHDLAIFDAIDAEPASSSQSEEEKPAQSNGRVEKPAVEQVDTSWATDAVSQEEQEALAKAKAKTADKENAKNGNGAQARRDQAELDRSAVIDQTPLAKIQNWWSDVVESYRSNGNTSTSRRQRIGDRAWRAAAWLGIADYPGEEPRHRG